MSTGGLALLIAALPFRSRGLTTIGTIVFIFDLFIYFLAKVSEPSYWVAVLSDLLDGHCESVNILGCIQRYGVPSPGPWLIVALRVLFRIYAACTFLSAGMTPAWPLPVFPIMLCGTLASLITGSQPPGHCFAIIVAGVAFQGLGLMISFLTYPLYLGRLMSCGLPLPNLRPGLFMAVGPPSFNGVALIGSAENLPQTCGYFAQHPQAIGVLQPLALFLGIITLLTISKSVRQMSFHLVWWAFVFPNVGFTLCTIGIGQWLESDGILWVATAMGVVLVVIWIVVFVANVKALLAREIMMPGRDEDKDEKVDVDHLRQD
ncbi:voltage-dependent anion channel-domain-containing protein [Cryomyces antarcticus]